VLTVTVGHRREQAVAQIDLSFEQRRVVDAIVHLAGIIAQIPVGRLGKGVAKAGSSGSGGVKPRADEFSTTYPPATTSYPPATGTGYTADTGYAAGTEYAATGTGRPVPVDEEYPPTSAEPRL